ncbi:MAG: type II toxin-antitoxin system VapB family antitoxin [Ornithinimicrobium sp.]
MSLNIESEHVHALAKEAARRTGRTQTSVIEVALTRLIDEMDYAAGAQVSGVDLVLSDMRSRIGATGVDLSTDDLYDGAGLPS